MFTTVLETPLNGYVNVAGRCVIKLSRYCETTRSGTFGVIQYTHTRTHMYMYNMQVYECTHRLDGRAYVSRPIQGAERKRGTGAARWLRHRRVCVRCAAHL